jgi:hypothetical protein
VSWYNPQKSPLDRRLIGPQNGSGRLSQQINICLSRESNSDFPVVQTVYRRLYLLSYPWYFLQTNSISSWYRIVTQYDERQWEHRFVARGKALEIWRRARAREIEGESRREGEERKSWSRKLAQAVMVRKVPGSNFGADPGNPDWYFKWFSPVPPGEYRNSTLFDRRSVNNRFIIRACALGSGNPEIYFYALYLCYLALPIWFVSRSEIPTRHRQFICMTQTLIWLHPWWCFIIR